MCTSCNFDRLTLFLHEQLVSVPRRLSRDQAGVVALPVVQTCHNAPICCPCPPTSPQTQSHPAPPRQNPPPGTLQNRLEPAARGDTLATDITSGEVTEGSAARPSERGGKRSHLQASASAASFTQRRRQDALERQRAARWDRTRHARLLALQQADGLASSPTVPNAQVSPSSILPCAYTHCKATLPLKAAHQLASCHRDAHKMVEALRKCRMSQCKRKQTGSAHSTRVRAPVSTGLASSCSQNG